MKRREFSLSAASAVAASAVTLPVALPAAAQVRQFKEGKDYQKLSKPAPTEAPAGKIEIIEFFWYSCPHCNSFEPVLDAWIKAAPKDLVVRRVPVAFNASFVPQQKLYYALEGMGKLIPELSGGETEHAADGDLRAWVRRGIAPVVMNERFGRIRLTHVNLNDGTAEGIQLLDAPCFSVQYHPEASPGPTDAHYLFTAFTRLMDGEENYLDIDTAKDRLAGWNFAESENAATEEN